MTALPLPRPRRVRPVAILAAAILLAVASQAGALLAPTTPATGPAAPGAQDPARPIDLGPIDPGGAPVAAGPGSLAQIDHSIAAWTANLAGNDRDFLSAANLAQLYEARARLSGDVTDYARAIEAADRSLAIEPRQLDVRALHARLLLATHEFRRALAEAESLDRTVRDEPAILAIVGDARLELGDIPGAAAAYERIAELQAANPDGASAAAPLTARFARLAFLRGDSAGAVADARRAYEAAATAGLAGPARSWYAYLAGVMSISSGDPEAAAAWFDKALEAWPQSHLALAGRARAAAALGDVDAAIAGYRAAIAVAPQPEALAALGDLLALQGDATGAAEQYATVRAIAELQGAGGGLVYNRQLVLFEVDHGGDVAGALALAEAELRDRKDVYGYDAFAWALLANGQAAEADAAMASALALGTRDARLLFHAGEIALAVGDEARARSLLEEALGIRGALDPLSTARAAAALESIR
ncbi:MAG TPA: tetratricopeptide repeat protein [Candidatus Binatia bacterium]|nr:tetratricopeptide repeat protein [Candidatus Binatia bacterium]